ncbi:MAG: sortase [Ilumatobacteraceae bacterium]
MALRQVKLLRGCLITLALASIVLGVVLVANDEIAKRDADTTFTRSQISLRSTFGVFDDPAASEPLPTITDGVSGDDAVGKPEPAIEAVALLSIPRIDLEVAAASYSNYDVLRYAVGYMPESAAPNEPGITYLVGHRTGFGAPFRELDQLRPGDVFTVKNAAGLTKRYRVEFVEIRKPSDALPELASLTGRNNVLLVTCHPEFSTELRLIVGASGA